MSGRIAQVFFIDRLYYPYLELPVEVFWLEENHFFLKQDGKDILAVMIFPNEPSQYLSMRTELAAKLVPFAHLCSFLAQWAPVYIQGNSAIMTEGQTFDQVHSSYSTLVQRGQDDNFKFVYTLSEDQKQKELKDFKIFLIEIKRIYQKYQSLINNYEFIQRAMKNCYDGIRSRQENTVQSAENSTRSFVTSLEALYNDNGSKITRKMRTGFITVEDVWFCKWECKSKFRIFVYS